MNSFSSFLNVSKVFTAMQSTSLSAYCKAHNLPKASVHKFLKAEGFDTAGGMTSEAIAAADAYFLDAKPTEPTPAAITPTVIEVGNHRGQLALPSQPSQIDLSEYRGNAPLASFEGLDIERFLEGCEAFVQAVEADYQKQVDLTQRKAATAAQVKATAEKVQRASLAYQMRSESIALHNAALDAEIQQGMTVLGKPQPAASPQP
jgi:hypothetical protein